MAHNVVYMGRDDFSIGMLGGTVSEDVRAGFRSNYDNYVSTLRHHDEIRGSRLAEEYTNMYDKFHNGWYDARATQVRNLLSRSVEPDRVRHLRTVQEFQSAPGCMYPYLLASPRAKRLYQQDRISGWHREYNYPKSNRDNVGFRDVYYRRVMDGILTKEDGKLGFNTYVGNHDKKLMLKEEDQINTLKSWVSLSRQLDMGLDDPTSLDGEQMS